jgi:hypothetical protein
MKYVINFTSSSDDRCDTGKKHEDIGVSLHGTKFSVARPSDVRKCGTMLI